MIGLPDENEEPPLDVIVSVEEMVSEPEDPPKLTPPMLKPPDEKVELPLDVDGMPTVLKLKPDAVGTLLLEVIVSLEEMVSELEPPGVKVEPPPTVIDDDPPMETEGPVTKVVDAVGTDTVLNSSTAANDKALS